ncbi:hypothetical protein SynA1562_01754 [Synechococcus sp. A15-62]|nr:hypothetical protein SynA1562_01754 [Synechococcus sp. A15-62]
MSGFHEKRMLKTANRALQKRYLDARKVCNTALQTATSKQDSAKLARTASEVKNSTLPRNKRFPKNSSLRSNHRPLGGAD